MIAPPDRLEDWTFNTVADLLRQGTYERSTLEFKEVLSPAGQGREHAIASIRKAICGMANTAGGRILFGVKDPQHPVADPIELIVGIPLTSELGKEFGDKVSEIHPPISFDPPRAIPIPTRTDYVVWVVHVPLSSARPHEYGGIFYRRGDGGQAQRMSVYEVRDQMLVTEERFRKLKLYRLELEDWRKRAARLAGYGEAVLHTWETFDVDYIKRLLVDVYALFPSDRLLDRLRDILSEGSLTNTKLASMHEGYSTWPLRGVDPDIPRLPIHTAVCDGMRLLVQLVGDYEGDLERAFGPLHAET